MVRDLAFLLHLELSFHKNVQEAKKELEISKDFSTINLFNLIDSTKLNYINIVSLQKFSEKLGFKMKRE